MRKQRLMMLAFVSFVMIALTVLCSASWFIIFRRSQTVTHVEADTSPFFTTGGTYNGGSYAPTLTKAGMEVYGADFEYEIEWQNGVRADGKDFSKAADGGRIGIAAGKHYYRIVDVKTGQVICQNHEVNITKATLTAPADITLNSYYMAGQAVSGGGWVDWTGENGDTYPLNAQISEVAPAFRGSSLVYTKTVKISTASISDEWMKNNYNESFVNISYRVVGTCYSYSEGKATYYSDLNEALDATRGATVATTVVAMQSFTANGITYTANPNATTGIKFTHAITGDRVVGANVTLLIPFRSTNSFNATEEGIKETDQYAISSTTTNSGPQMSGISGTRFTPTPACVNEVTLTNGTLNNQGRIEICGLTGFSYPDSLSIAQGATSGVHGTITMENAEILMDTASSSMEVRGYIANNGNAKVTAKKGTITMPFVIYDYHGGTITVALFKGSGSALTILNSDNANLAPFNILDMPNIQAELTCYGGSSGAKIEGIANLFTNGIDLSILGKLNAQFNVAKFDLFASTGALFNMTDGYAVFQYNFEDNSSYAYNKTNYNPPRNARTKIVLNGDTTSGDIRMTLNVGFGDANVSLSQVKFPISHKIQLCLEGDHDYAFTTNYKFLPGSELYIRGGARVKVNSAGGLLFYESVDLTAYPDPNDSTIMIPNGTFLYYTYYSREKGSTPALCQIEDGSLIVEGSLGGTVTAAQQNSVLDLSKATALSMVETDGDGSRDGLNFTFTPKVTVSLSAKGSVATGTNSFAPNKVLSKYSYPMFLIDNGYVWYSPAASITLNANTTDNTGVFINGTATTPAVVPVDQSSGTTQATMDALEKPSRTGYKFAGWYLDAACTRPCGLADIKFDGVTLYAKWEEVDIQVHITHQSSNPSTETPGTYVDIFNEADRSLDDTFVTLTDVGNSENSAFSHYLNGWSAVWTFNVNTQAEPIVISVNYSAGQTISIASVMASAGIDESMLTANPTAVLTAQWSAKVKITVTTNASTVTVTRNNATITARPFYLNVGDTFIVEATANSGNKIKSTTIGGKSYELGSNYTISSSGDLAVVVETESCIAAGTMITLADGTQKAVEDLVESDILLVFDHETGKYVECPILFIERDGWAEYTVINLTFSNGTTTRLIYEHGLFDLTLNRYVYITEQNYREFVGHEFAVMSEYGYETVIMTDAFLTTEYTGCYSLVTVYHFNYFIDGLFSMPGGIEGLFNFFEYDEDLRFDAEKMAADIEKYGLYTYEEFAPYMPEEIFNIFQARYYKIAVEKGMITFEEIVALIERYLVQHGIV